MAVTGAVEKASVRRAAGRPRWTLVVSGLLAAGSLVGQATDTSPGRSPVSSVGPAPRAPQTYGTTWPSYYAIDASALTPNATTVQYACTNNCQLRYASNDTGYVLAAPVRLPAGALVVYMELDYYDASPTGRVNAVFADCDYAGQACQFLAGSCPDLGTTVCSGDAAADGFGSVGAVVDGAGIVIDNYNHRYFVLVGNTTLDGTTAFSQVSIGYVLQVSPPPAVATFGDVPISHPFFQFIEALAKSGITGGCGNGNYCPDAPLTRGQMAVFLAKALGLQWP